MRYILLLASALIISMASTAQKHSIRGVGGFNYTIANDNNLLISGTDDGKKRSQVNLSGGIGYTFQASEIIRIGIEASYSQRGYRTVHEAENGDMTRFHYNLNYIETPLFFGFSTKTNFKVYGHIGVVPSILLNARHYKDGDNFPDGETLFDLDISDRHESFVIQAFVEPGIEYNISDNLFMSFGIRYSQVITNMYTDMASEEHLYEELSTRVAFTESDGKLMFLSAILSLGARF